jgi:hypothetical protein
MFASRIDIIMTILLALGLIQIAWLSVMFARKGIAAATITAALPPFIAIWILLWPLYEAPGTIWAGVIILGLPTLLAYALDNPFWQQLRVVWSGPAKATDEQPLPHMWPYISLLTAIAIATAFFQRAPEFGLGIGLAACLAFPAAAIFDKLNHMKLGFPIHPEQTLVGHIALIIGVSTICMWSIHVYHGIEWQRLLIATLIAGMIASVVRGFSPAMLTLPLATLAMGTTLWLL